MRKGQMEIVMVPWAVVDLLTEISHDPHIHVIDARVYYSTDAYHTDEFERAPAMEERRFMGIALRIESLYSPLAPPGSMLTRTDIVEFLQRRKVMNVQIDKLNPI
jgi:hypothetical protein